jgi:hypothetical protein
LTNQKSLIIENLRLQANLALNGDSIVWINDRQIWRYDISDKKTYQITHSKTNKYNPAIFENMIVWEELRGIQEKKPFASDNDIHGYDISGNVEFLIAGGENDQTQPAIWKDIVVWREEKDDILSRNSFHYINGKNLNTGEEFEIDPIFLFWGKKAKTVLMASIVLLFFIAMKYYVRSKAK